MRPKSLARLWNLPVGFFQYLDQEDKWEAASPALTCPHICLQPKPDAPTSINSSAALDVKGEAEAGGAVRGPAVYTFTPREAGAVCGTNHTSHILYPFTQVLAQHPNKGTYSALMALSSVPTRHGLLAGAVQPSVHSNCATLDSLVDVYSVGRGSLRRHSPQTRG